MLNNWKWKRSNSNYSCSHPDEYWLYNDDEKLIAFIYRRYYDDNIWDCSFSLDGFNSHFSVTFEDIKSAEKALWQATLWIYDTCNRVANNFHYVRDHLPSLHELIEQSDIADCRSSNK